MTTIGFIGLGIMGRPMAAHLVAAGHDVVGYDLFPAGTDHLVAAGGRAARDVAEVSSQADVVITMVPDSPDAEAVALGDAGVYTNAKPGTLHIDCSTIRPDVSRRLHEAGATAGIAVVDAPVSGGEAGAKEASLSIMMGGDPEAIERAAPIMAHVGTTVVHVGPAGAGQTVKAANQLIVAGNIQLVAEAIVFLEAHGVDMDSALAVLAGGLAGSTVLDRKSANMLARRFEPGFRIDLHHKDLGIVTAAAREAGVPLPLSANVAQLVGSLRSMGHGSLDHSALLLQLDVLSGRSRDACADE